MALSAFINAETLCVLTKKRNSFLVVTNASFGDGSWTCIYVKKQEIKVVESLALNHLYCMARRDHRHPWRMPRYPDAGRTEKGIAS